MANPVGGVSGVGKTDRNRKQPIVERGSGSRRRPVDTDDLVEISDEAKDKASGKAKKSILDYVNE